MTKWPVPASSNYNADLADARNRAEIHTIRMELRETGAMPFNGVTIVDKIESQYTTADQAMRNLGIIPVLIHECVTPDFLWERMAPSLEIRNEDGNIPTYEEFEGYAIERSHAEFLDTHRESDRYCDSCDCLRMIWLRYQLTAAFVECTNERRKTGYSDSYDRMMLESLSEAIQYELRIAEDVFPNDRPASPNHPAGKDSK